MRVLGCRRDAPGPRTGMVSEKGSLESLRAEWQRLVASRREKTSVVGRATDDADVSKIL